MKKINIEEVIEQTNKRNVSKKAIIIVIVLLLLVILTAGYFLFIPNVVINGENYIKVKLNDEYNEKGAKVESIFKSTNSNVIISGDVDVTKPGKYKIEYSTKEGIFTKKATRVVEVVDDIAPVIELVGGSEVNICPNKEYIEEGYTATDNYDKDLTSKVKTEIKEDEIIYTVEDSSGNKTKIERKLTKVDQTAPSIKLNGDKNIYIALNSKYNEKGASASDNCDGDLTDQIKITGSVNENKAGTYKVSYQVTDSNGNESKVDRTVIVYNKNQSTYSVNKTGTIYLTFDDGPSATITAKVLDILKEKDVKATFFVINHSNNLNYLIKREYDEGHTVGLHSYTHDYKTIYSSPTAYFEDLEKISNKVKSITGEETKIIRFPGGGSNTVSRKYNKGIMTYLTNEVINRGYHYFDWNVSSSDAGGAKNKTQVYNEVTKALKHNRANIVLMHDFENNYKTLNALSDIIDYGKKNGYTFQAIDMTTPLVRHGVNN